MSIRSLSLVFFSSFFIMACGSESGDPAGCAATCDNAYDQCMDDGVSSAEGCMAYRSDCIVSCEGGQGGSGGEGGMGFIEVPGGGEGAGGEGGDGGDGGGGDGGEGGSGGEGGRPDPQGAG